MGPQDDTSHSASRKDVANWGSPKVVPGLEGKLGEIHWR